MTGTLAQVVDKLRDLAAENDVILTDTQIKHAAGLMYAAYVEKRQYGVTRMASGKGLLITTYDHQDCLVDVIRLCPPAKSKLRKVPRKDWLRQVMLPFRQHKDFKEELDLVYSFIYMIVQDGGSWVAKVNDHFVEFDLKDFTGNVVNTFTIRKTGDSHVDIAPTAGLESA